MTRPNQSPWSTVRRAAGAWWLVPICGAAAALAALAFSSSDSDRYRAETSLLLGSAPYQQAVAGGYSPVDSQRRLGTATDLLGSPAVTTSTRRRVGPLLRRAAYVSTEFENADRSDVIRLVTTSDDPRVASAVANATADAYADLRRELNARTLADTRNVLADQIGTAPSTRERRALIAKRNNLAALEALENQQVQIVERASVPARATATDLNRNVAIALVLGLVVGVALSLLRAHERPAGRP